MSNLSVDLSDKVALVTGGGNGIGRACAMAFARSGARVAIVDISEKALNEIKQEIESEGGTCQTYTCDITSKANIDQMVEDVMQWQNKIDILVNSAGINIQQPAKEVTEEAWDKIMAVNTKGLFFCCQAVGKKMIPQKQGKIINISSTMSLVGFFRRAAYCASKGAVSQLTKVLAVEWAPHNININCVAPTFIKTPFTEPMFKEQAFYEEVVSRIPMGRVGDTEDVVGAVLFLASDASNFATGGTLLVDGGWVAW